MDATIAELLDKQAITEAIYRYPRGLDRMDKTLTLSVFHPDATTDYGADIFRGPAVGLVEALWAFQSGGLASQHQMHNILITLDGDSAASETYASVYLRVPGPDGTQLQVTNYVRYVDQWSRRDGRWGIDSRAMILDFDTVVPITSNSARAGTRDTTDPSYTALPTL